MKLSASALPVNYNDAYWLSPNFDNLRAYILYSLGYPVVRIELVDQQLNVAIHDAISKFMKYGYGLIDINMVEVNLDQNGEAPLPPEIISPSLIKDVLFISRSLDTQMATDILGEAAVYGFVNGTYDFFSLSDYSFDLAKYVLWRKNLDEATDILGLKKSWEVFNGKLKVFPVRQVNSYPQAGILYGKFLTQAEFETDDWVRAYATEKARYILGTIRGKFSNFAAPGGQGSIDGEQLKADATVKMQELIEELKSLRPSPPMMQF